MGNLLIDGHVNVKIVVFNSGKELECDNNGWTTYVSPLKSLDLTIEIDLKSSGDVSFLLGDDGLPCRVKINNYIMDKLNGGVL